MLRPANDHSPPVEPWMPSGLRFGFSKSPAPFMAELVEGLRSAEPPKNPGTFLKKDWITLSEALRVATGLSDVDQTGRSLSQSGANVPAMAAESSAASSGCAAA